jgi:hypothetical protein
MHARASCRTTFTIGLTGAAADEWHAELRRYPTLLFLWALQASEQYLTSSQTLAHFLRQTNGRLQTKQVFTGRSLFSMRLAMPNTSFVFQKMPRSQPQKGVPLEDGYRTRPSLHAQ